MGVEPLRCAIVAVDIEGFGSPIRTDPLRAWLRERLYELVDHALATAEVRRSQVLLRSDLGDGLLLLLDPSVSLARLLCQVIPELADALATHNGKATKLAAHLRLRVAVHRGQVLRDAHGYAGQDLNHAFRLLDAKVTRAALDAVAVAELVVVVSDRVRQDMATHRNAGVDPAAYQPVWIVEKETAARVWVHLPGLAVQPPIVKGVPGQATLAERSDEGGDEVQRRELLVYAGTLAGSITLDRLVGERRATVEDALVADRVARRLHALGETLPAQRAYAAVLRHADAVARLTRSATNRRVQHALLRVLVHAQAFAGFVAAFDLQDHRRAQARLRHATHAAHDLDDPVMSGLVCLRMSDSARALGTPREALELATAGCGLLGSADPALLAGLHTAAARAHVRVREQAAALRALERAERLLTAPTMQPSPWTRMDLARFLGTRGMVEVRLGRFPQAAEALHAGITAYPANSGFRAAMQTDLASMLFQQDDPEQAARVATAALAVATQLGSKSRLARFSTLDPYLARYAGVPAVHDVAGELRLARSSATNRNRGDRGRRQAP